MSAKYPKLTGDIAPAWHITKMERYNWKVEEDAKAPEPWEPEDGEKFFFVTDTGNVDSYVRFRLIKEFNAYLSVGNCYRAREEAEKAAERVRKAYKE